MKQTLITSYNTLLAPRVKAATLLETKTRERLTCKTSLFMWCNQLSILLQRNLKERKHETFNGLRFFQVIGIFGFETHQIDSLNEGEACIACIRQERSMVTKLRCCCIRAFEPATINRFRIL
ncbi:ABC transporter G family member 25, partial [Cucurbita argyrosperma subsp. argyrosperma]